MVRPIRPSDEDYIKAMFYAFSEQTKYLRYHGTLKALPHNKLQVFCNVDYDTEMAWSWSAARRRVTKRSSPSAAT